MATIVNAYKDVAQRYIDLFASALQILNDYPDSAAGMHSMSEFEVRSEEHTSELQSRI